MPNIRRNMQDLVNNPRGYLEMIADRLQNASKGRRAVINDQGAGYRNLTQQERLQAVQQAALDNLGGGGLGIIKAKGGNWLTGSVENALKRLKRPLTTGLDDLKEYLTVARAESPELVPRYERELALRTQGAALNNWIEGPLTKYVKRDMATEGDPVRKLAEQGILHINPDTITRNVDSATYANRGAAGFSPWGVAESDLAKSWENLSDRSVASGFAGRMSESAKAQNPWLEKLAAEERVYQPSKIGHEGLGFNHLTDELANALNPESGLPRHLLLTPEQMQQMGMEKAVRHVDAINKWRAAQKAEANAKLAQSPAVHMVREYAENNPKGLRWVELKSPDRWPEGIDPALKEEFGDLGRYSKKTLGDQLKYEGDTMGHCVGGYCDDVASGRSRIFSLRDAKGEPHVTIETQSNLRGLRTYLQQFEHPERPGRLEPDALGITDTLHDYVQANRRGNGDYDEFGLETLKRLGHPLPPDSIVQIKGKQNLKPKDEYLPFVQDFVRNHPEGGKWGDIGDLNNAGLYRHHVSKYPESVKDLGEYASKEDIENWVANNVKPTPGFAQGGSVQGNTTWRPMELDGIIGYITE